MKDRLIGLAFVWVGMFVFGLAISNIDAFMGLPFGIGFPLWLITACASLFCTIIGMAALVASQS